LKSGPAASPQSSLPQLRLASILLQPKLIHTRESIRPLHLQCMPPIKIAHGAVATENRSIMLENLRLKLESDKPQVVVAEKRLDLRNRRPGFLNMEQ
jgi:hypothetical protein